MIAGLLLLVALGVIAARNWDTVSMVIDNASSMGEGAEAARSIRSPDDLLTYIAQHPEQASLAAYDLDDPAAGVFYQSDKPRTVTRVPVLQLLAGYAQQAARGTVDPTRHVLLDSLAAYALPGVSQSSHEQMVEQLRQAGRADTLGRAALGAVMLHAAQTGGRTASDWWMMVQGQDAVERLPAQLHLQHSTAPRPLTGRTLLGRDRSLDALRSLSPEAQQEAAFALAGRLRRDATFRSTQRRQLEQEGSNLTLQQQRDIALVINPRGTARDYAALLDSVATGTAPSAEAASILHDMLERPVTAADTVETPFASVATYGGASPGVLSFVGYARYADGRSPRVVVLLMDNLPIAVMYHLLQTGIDKGFQLQLLGDDAYLQHVREVLADTSAAPTALRETTIEARRGSLGGALGGAG